MSAASRIQRIPPARGGKRAWRTAVCVISGHEKWTTRSGDWTCMRCGKVKFVDFPTFPASAEVRRSEISALLRFGVVESAGD